MKPDLILEADMLDILFENRNKEYGAYALRRDYNGRLVKAVIATLIGSSLFVVLVFYLVPANSALNRIAQIIPPDTQLKKIEILEKPELPPPARQPAASIQYTTPVIVQETDQSIPDQTTLEQDALISTQTVEGPPASTVTDATEISTTEAAPAAPVAEEPSILTRSEIMPEFPGGEAAMKRFMMKTLRAPGDELEPGAKIIVRARFVVDKDGSITGVEILESGGHNYDNEVKRMLLKMPAWKPGFQNGRNVAVYFNLPVVFVGPEE